MEAGVDDVLFWGALSFALVVAGFVASRSTAGCWRAARATPPSTRPASTAAPDPLVVGWIAGAWPRVFGATVLLAELLSG